MYPSALVIFPQYSPRPLRVTATLLPAAFISTFNGFFRGSKLFTPFLKLYLIARLVNIKGF